MNVFKKSCVTAADKNRCEVVVSFEMLTRDVPGFPSRVMDNDMWIVGDWGQPQVTAESWYYANHGINGTPPKRVMFAEVLAFMMTKFQDNLPPLGFQTCEREAGTWKLRVTWKDPDDPSVTPEELAMLKNEVLNAMQQEEAAPKPAAASPASPRKRSRSKSERTRSPSRSRSRKKKKDKKKKDKGKDKDKNKDKDRDRSRSRKRDRSRSRKRDRRGRSRS